MALLKSKVVLDEDEELVMELEAELWATSSNIFAQIIGWFRKLYAFLLGIRNHGYVVITNKRVVEVKSLKMLWIFDTSKEVKFLLPTSITEVGYKKSGTFLGCFCHAYKLYYESITQSTEVMLKGVDEVGAQKIVDAFYSAMFSKK